MTQTLLLVGQCKSGKNALMTTRTGHRYPTESFTIWRNDAIIQVKNQWTNWRAGPIIAPCRIVIHYWPGDLRRRDVPGMEDALFHVLERAGITTDDTFFQDVHFVTQELDRKNPRVSIEVFI